MMGLCCIAKTLGVVLLTAAATAESARLSVFVSIPPQAGLVERIGGEHVTVDVLVRPGQEPHLFEPTPKQMMTLGKADLYFQVGTLPFETRLVKKIRQAHPELPVVDTSKGVQRRKLEDDHGHGDGHEGTDPHIWLGPGALRIQAKSIAEALATAAPNLSEVFGKNLEKFEKDLDAVDAEIRKGLAPYRGRSVLVFHPSFGYFTDAYGLRQEIIEVQGKTPSPKQIQTAIRAAREAGARTIFVQPQFDGKAAETIARAIGGKVVPMDPLAVNVLKNLRVMGSTIEHTLRKEGAPDGQ